MPSSPAVPLPSPDFYLRAPPHEVAGETSLGAPSASFLPRRARHQEIAHVQSPRVPPLAGTLTCPGDGQARTESSGGS